MEFRVMIPARYASSRLPGKVLAEIEGKPMMQHVYERALESGALSIVIATDDEKVFQAAEKFGAQVIMTATDHSSGTERLSEAALSLGYDDEDIIVNLQCDVPFIPPSVICQAAESLAEHDNIKMVTLCEPLEHSDEMDNRDIVKVIRNKRGYAMYFSRANVPWTRDQGNPPKECIELGEQHRRHIGLYAYYTSFLQEFIRWEPCGIEALEQLEQLRVLYNGGRILVEEVSASAPIMPGIDTPAQLEEARNMAKSLLAKLKSRT